jgi:predicted nucleic acid-binding protein
MIVDASVAFKWLVEEPDSNLALSWLRHDDLKAPAILLAEVGNAMAKRIRGRELKADGAPERLAQLEDMLTIVDGGAFAARALTVSLELGHSSYDCIYLALAEILDEQLLTADQVFVKKCQAGRWSGRVRPLALFDH